MCPPRVFAVRAEQERQIAEIDERDDMTIKRAVQADGHQSSIR